MRLVLLLTLWTATAHAATYTVDRKDDTVVDGCADGVASDCTLRGAVAKAIDGDVIVVPATSITLQSDVILSKTIEIRGAGADSTTLTATTRHFQVNAGVVTLRGLRLQGSVSASVLNQASLIVEACSFRNNTSASGSGAAISQTIGQLLVRQSHFGGNSAATGAAIAVFGGSALIANSTFEGNQATQSSGVIVAANATVRLRNCTVANNTGVSGGALSAVNGGQIHVGNSIVFGNTAANAAANCAASSVISHGHNLIGAGCTYTALATDSASDPLLQPASDNGGPTLTLALGAASPALEAGAALGPSGDADADCQTTDQRGVGRPRFGKTTTPAKCDIGAFEAATVRLSSSVLRTSAAIVPHHQIATWTITLANANATAGQVPTATATNVLATATLPLGATEIVATGPSGSSCSVGLDIECTIPSLAPGTTAPITIAARMDTATAGNKFLTVTSVTSAETSVSPAAVSASVFVQPLISLAPVTAVSEGTSVTVTVQLSAPNPTATPIQYRLSTRADTAIVSEDFTAMTVDGSFAQGASSASFSVATIDDVIPEPAQQLFADLSNLVGATAASGSIAIVVNDTPDADPLLRLKPVADIGEASGTLTLGVVASVASQRGDATFRVSIAPFGAGHAQQGTDWGGAETQTLTLLAGTNAKLISIPIIDDTAHEALERLTVTLDQPTNATIDPSFASVSPGIVDDDQPSQLFVDDVVVNEAAGVALVTVRAEPATGVAIEVDVATVSGTADASDFTPHSSRETIVGASITVSIPITNDAVDEADELFAVSLANATNATLGDDLAAITIVDDDEPIVIAPTGSTGATGATGETGAAEQPVAELAITVTPSTPRASEGDRVSFAVLVRNGGGAASAETRIIIVKPAALSSYSLSSADAVCADLSDRFVCNVASIAPGGSVNIGVTATVVDAGVLTLSASVDSASAEASIDVLGALNVSNEIDAQPITKAGGCNSTGNDVSWLALLFVIVGLRRRVR